MTELNFKEYSDSILTQLDESKQCVLATCADNYITTRIVCPLLMDGAIMISTKINNLKSAQIKKNANVALSFGHLNVEAEATLYGHPSTYPEFQTVYNKKYPDLASIYESSPDDVLIICKIKKVQLYSYIDFPGKDIIDFEEEKAYRIEL